MKHRSFKMLQLLYPSLMTKLSTPPCHLLFCSLNNSWWDWNIIQVTVLCIYCVAVYCWQLLKALPVLQSQVDSLLEFDVSDFFVHCEPKKLHCFSGNNFVQPFCVEIITGSRNLMNLEWNDLEQNDVEIVHLSWMVTMTCSIRTCENKLKLHYVSLYIVIRG